MDQPTIAELEPFRHICKDVAAWNSSLQSSVESFYEKVERRARTRGWKQIMLLDLPKVGSLYDSGLSSGSFAINDLPSSFGKASIQTFDGLWIFRDLLSLTFDGFGTLDETTPAEVVAATRQLLYSYKKTSLNCPRKANEDAVQDYIDIEESLWDPSGSWSDDEWVPNRFTFSDSLEHKRMLSSRRIWRILDSTFPLIGFSGSLDPEDIVPKHGPGAVADLHGESDKFWFPYWPAKLEGLFPYSVFGLANESLPVHYQEWSDEEPSARLIAVPKTFKGPRLIASEPTAHQFIQQGLMRWTRDNLSRALRNCISFQDQTPSQDLTLEASVTGQLATVDLSSASDRLSCWVVERAFGHNQTYLAALHASRSRTIENGTEHGGDFVLQLKKFAAQGSAVTFPVQTIVYAGCCIASILHDKGWKVTSKNIERCSKMIRVYGDDIIIPSSYFATLVALLTDLQLKVNVGKSHFKGHFRESCGMDAYKGVDVTPVYINDLLPPRSNPEAILSWVDISNIAHTKLLWRTAAWMIGSLDKRIHRKIIFSDAAGPGIRATTFCRGQRFHGQHRFNPVLQLHEIKPLTFKTANAKVARGSWHNLLQYFLERPSPDTHWESGYVTTKSVLLEADWVPAS